MNFLSIQYACSDSAMLALLTIVRRILAFIQIVGPLLALVSLSIHIIRLMKNPDDKKGWPRVKNSSIALVMLFFIPTIVNAAFGMLGDSTEISSCWNGANINIAREVTYQPIDGTIKSKGFIINPGEYEKGTPKPSPSPSSGSGTEGQQPWDGTGSGTPGGGTSGTPVTFSGGTLVKKEETSTLKVYVYKSGGYYVTQIWAANPYQQLNKYDSPNYGSSLVRPKDLLQRATNERGLGSKLVVGFNASGFYLRNVYDAASVNAYGAYDKTSVGTLVITDGKVVRNAYSHAVKTWYITGVDQSNRLRIFEDQKSGDANAKKAWSESIIGTVRNTFTFASPLVVNGQASNITTSMPSPGSSLNRQAICQVDAHNFVLITGGKLNRNDLIGIMQKLNCQTGTNLDGGGSIALLFKGKGSNIETIIGGGRALTEVGYFSE